MAEGCRAAVPPPLGLLGPFYPFCTDTSCPNVISSYERGDAPCLLLCLRALDVDVDVASSWSIIFIYRSAVKVRLINWLLKTGTIQDQVADFPRVGTGGKYEA